jgi:hypothetical protein
MSRSARFGWGGARLVVRAGRVDSSRKAERLTIGIGSQLVAWREKNVLRAWSIFWRVRSSQAWAARIWVAGQAVKRCVGPSGLCSLQMMQWGESCSLRKSWFFFHAFCSARSFLLASVISFRLDAECSFPIADGASWLLDLVGLRGQHERDKFERARRRTCEPWMAKKDRTRRRRCCLSKNLPYRPEPRVRPSGTVLHDKRTGDVYDLSAPSRVRVELCVGRNHIRL